MGAVGAVSPIPDKAKADCCGFVTRSSTGKCFLAMPADKAGWHSNGTAPGDIGPAVVVGHVDSYQGPAIFYRLRELVSGDRVAVDRADGSQVIFEVYDKETVRKDAFPTERVYGETSTPELRLLTCGGRSTRRRRATPRTWWSSHAKWSSRCRRDPVARADHWLCWAWPWRYS